MGETICLNCTRLHERQRIRSSGYRVAWEFASDIRSFAKGVAPSRRTSMSSPLWHDRQACTMSRSDSKSGGSPLCTFVSALADVGEEFTIPGDGIRQTCSQVECRCPAQYSVRLFRRDRLVGDLVSRDIQDNWFHVWPSHKVRDTSDHRPRGLGRL